MPVCVLMHSGACCCHPFPWSYNLWHGAVQVDPAQLCFIAFLPNILDSKAEGRNGYIDSLKTLANDFKDRCGCTVSHLG
jgi:hypothetical protein